MIAHALDPQPPRAAAGELALSDAEFRTLSAFILEQTGIVLGDAKRQLVISRLAKRVRKLGLGGFGDYCAHLRENDPRGDELREMINAITTNKTSFYREEHHFAQLEAHLAQLAPQPGEPLRVWCSAASTGEEPYTIAITLREALERGTLRAPSGVKILATDIDTDVLARAEAGVYERPAASGLSAERMQKHFTAGTGDQAGCIRARDSLRELISFRRLNLIAPAWPLRVKFDAIFCRNVLIYFDRATQRAVVGRLVAQLRVGGTLYLGHSEGLLGMRPDLASLGQTAFRRIQP